MKRSKNPSIKHIIDFSNFWYPPRAYIDRIVTILIWESILVPVRQNIELSNVLFQHVYGITGDTLLRKECLTTTTDDCEAAYKVIRTIPE